MPGQRGQAVVVHGWVYGLHNGLLEDLRIAAASATESAWPTTPHWRWSSNATGS